MDEKESKKGSERMAGLLNKASGFGKKVAEGSKKVASGTQSMAKALSEKAKDEGYLRRLKKYNPLFPADYESESFHLPNMIMIVDDAVRKGIDVCEGAIGWLNVEGDMEVLYLYDEAVEMSGIRFVPTATCDTIYYVDEHDRSRYLRLDDIFSRAHSERLAELEHIAYSLGAKWCTVEIAESMAERESTKTSSSVDISGPRGTNISSSDSYEKSQEKSTLMSRSGTKRSTFQGHNNPQQPTLKWFAYEDNIKNLIQMRLTDPSSVKSIVLELKGSSSATMQVAAAGKIDSALVKMKAKASATMKSTATKESQSMMFFELEF